MVRFQAVDGYFHRRSEPSKADTPTDTPQLFTHYELTPSSWQELAEKLEKQVQSAGSRNLKVVYLIRHAEGIHNAKHREVGTEVWERDFARNEEFLDPALTPFGESDALQKGPPSLRAESTKGMPPIQKIVVSPLQRTIRTAQLFFGDSQEMVSIEACRETIGVHTCDKRSPLSKITKQFPNVDFSVGVKDEEDVLWRPEHRETAMEQTQRAREFMEELFDKVEEQYVAVVTHCGFIGAFCSVVLPDEGLIVPQNCEVIPVVVQKVQKD